ncbi:MAG: hypothetical protein ABIJ92_04895 [Candidatus Aenigmatarchaeota archaeon]
MISRHVSPKEQKIRHIIDLAIGIPSIIRMCERGASVVIENKFDPLLNKLIPVKSKIDLDKIREEFCRWAESNIKQCKSKEVRLVSWGQAAKIFDVGLKVCVYYCHLPDNNTANRISPFLNCPIDEQIQSVLVRNGLLDKNTRLKKMGKEHYEKIQYAVREDMKTLVGVRHPIEYDEVNWEPEKFLKVSK